MMSWVKANKVCFGMVLFYLLAVYGCIHLQIPSNMRFCAIYILPFLLFLCYLIYEYKNHKLSEKIDVKSIVFIIVILLLNFVLIIKTIEKYGLYQIYGIVSFKLDLMILFFSILFLYGVFLQKWKLENIFLTVAVPMGIFMMFNMPLRIVPDEVAHIYTSYRNADILLGINSMNDETFSLRKTDSALFTDNIEYACDLEMMNSYYSKASDYTGLDEVIDISSTNTLAVNDISHCISAIPIAFCKLQGINGFWTFMSGRTINLFCYILLIYLSIKYIPFAKLLPFTIALLPMAVQQGMSYSYDSWIISSSIYVISVSLALFDKSVEILKQDIILLIITSISLTIMKSKAYILIGLFPLYMAVQNKYKQNKLWKRIWIFILIILFGFIGYALLDKIFDFPDFFTEPYNPISWCNNEQGYTFQYCLNNPMVFLHLVLNTTHLFPMYLGQLICRGMGWLNINLSYIIWIIFFVALFLSVSFSGEKYEVSNEIISYMFFSILVTIIGIFYGLMVGWTTVTSAVILGVQGRYFIPLLPMIGVIIYSYIPKKIQNKNLWTLLLVFGYMFTVIELISRF